MYLFSSWMIAALYIFKGTLAVLEISPKPAYGKENGSVTFHCTSTVPFETAVFYSNDGRYVFTINFTNKPCTATDTSTESREYSYTCSGNHTLLVEIIKLTRKDNSVDWKCVHVTSGLQTDSKLYVNVSVENVTLSTSLKEYDNNDVAKVTENSSIEINCTSSLAYPSATVSLNGYDDSRKIYHEYPSTDTLLEKDENQYVASLAIFHVTLNRTTKALIFFCKATNGPQVEAKSGNLSVQILYPPTGAPVILRASSEYLIIEDSMGHLTCAIGDSNPPTHLNWTCSSILQSNITDTINNQANLTWTARRYTNTTCTCLSRYETASSGNVSLRIITLFPVNIIELKLNGTQNNVNLQEIRMIEDSTAKIEWITEGNPQPVVEWTEQLQNGTSIEPVDSNSNVYNVKKVHRSRNGTLLQFQAKNNMKDSSGKNESRTVEKDLTLIVLYPPDVNDMNNVTLIERSGRDVQCEISSGNVDAISVKWTSQKENRTALTLHEVKRSDSGWFSCEVSYNMATSLGDSKNGSIVKKFYLDVLYPPEGIIVNSTTSPSHQLHDQLKIIHNDVVELYCYASGKPVPQEYEWSGLNSSKSNVIVLKGNKNDTGNVTCSAYNNMTEQPGSNTTRGTGNRTIVVEVLYPPTIDMQLTQKAIEGNPVNISCNVAPGNPNITTVIWTGITAAQTHVSVTDSLLQFYNVSRVNSKNYTCSANNTMEPTFGKMKYGDEHQTLYLDVLYPPDQMEVYMSSDLMETTAVEETIRVIENNSLEISLTCYAESNPQPSIYYWKGPLESNSKTLNFTAVRNLNGTYICVANNTMEDDDGNNITGHKKQTYTVDILYPPEIFGLTNHSVIEGNDFEIFCDASSGNPTNQTITWTYFTEILERNQTLSFANASRNESGFYTCEVEYMLRPTYGELQSDTKTSTFYLDILYPPEKMKVQLHLGVDQEPYTIADNSLFIVENVSTSLFLLCSADGNPVPIDFQWNGPKDIQSTKLEFLANRTFSGNYTCNASSTMHPSDENSNEVTASTSLTFFLDFLYPPEIFALTNHSVIEGNDFEIFCDVSLGHPTNQTIMWTDFTEILERNQTLSFSKASRNESGFYSCEVEYMLVPTFGELQSGKKTSTFYLDILYPAEKMKVRLKLGSDQETKPIDNSTLFIVENVSTPIRLFCSADGNPVPSDFQWNGPADWQSRDLQFLASRNYSGNYTCNASNTLHPSGDNKEEFIASTSRTFFVEFLYPPMFHAGEKQNVVEGDNVNISCATLGKTTNRSVKWLSDKSEFSVENNYLNFTSIERNQAGNYTCQLYYELRPTYGDFLVMSENQTTDINVLYKPENVSAFINIYPDKPIERNFSLIEDTSFEIVLTCSASGNPEPTSYTWSGKMSNQSSVLVLTTERNINGSYICQAQNVLNPSDKKTENGTAMETFDIDILYPPEVNGRRNVNASVETYLSEDCISNRGKTTTLSWCWYRNRKERDCNQSLVIKNVTIDDKGNYSCVVNYTMIPSYGNENSSSISTEIFLSVNPKVMSPENDGQEGGLNTGAVVGGAVGGVAVIVVAAVAAVYIVRHRTLFSRVTKSSKQNVYVNVGFDHDPKQDKRLPAVPPSEEPDKEIDTANDISQPNFFDEENNPYINTMELVEIKKISVSELFMYVSNKSKKDFYEEFEKFPKGLEPSVKCTVARRPEYVHLNRYQGIYPYDHSRVHLLEVPNFFINANYIDGYTRRRQYIASLGPTERHTLGFTMFWNMVWYEKSDVIVMLTNLSEPSGMKCEQYWPDYGKSMEVDNFLIQSETEDEAAEYTLRTFSVSKGEESRVVTQLHYTAWPDKTVPESVTSLIEFRQRVKAVPTRSLGPLVVHCSAGVGRTGTYIALDRLIEEGKSTDHVNVFECVMSMRKQRVNMVQTPEQYVYLHQALVYCLAFDIEPVTAETVGEYIQTTSNNVFSQLYQQLKQTVEKVPEEYIEAQNKHASFTGWNRRRADIPGDRHRVLLSLDKEFGQSNYINAMYLSSFLRRDHFITAQSPLPKTVEDFVGMLYQETSACIVALDDYGQKGTNNVKYLPEENDQFTYGLFSISCLSVNAKPAYIVRKLTLKHDGKHEQGEKVAYHFEFTAWKHDEKLPSDPKVFLEFVREVEDYAKESTEENPHVVVHCMSGSERSGLFCAVSDLIQKMALENQVSVVNMLRRVRERRRTAISSMEQLKFCYHVVNAFVKKTQHLSTRKKSSLVHYENNMY